MPHEIIYQEKYGSTGEDVVYVKPPNENSIVRLGASSLKFEPANNVVDSCKGFLHEVFLPQGYPESVSDDYIEYQMWDTLQAFCSTIAGTMTAQAVMIGVGVGDETASSLGAAITWILKDGTGMIGRIMFAWWKGSNLDTDCKKWRLCADVLNDAAMCTELILLPHLQHYSLHILCASTSMKAVVGVAGGATRAAITQHQAIRGNMGDVLAKDGSQETCVNLVASIVGVLLLSSGSGEVLWGLFFVVTVLHIYANYRAVRSLQLNTFNAERLAILLRSYLMTEMVAGPTPTNRRESVVLGYGLTDHQLCGYRIALGSSLQELLTGGDGGMSADTGQQNAAVNAEQLRLLSHLYRQHNYLLVRRHKEIHAVMGREPTAMDVLQAYCHAVLLGIATAYVTRIPLEILSKQPGVQLNATYPLDRLKYQLDQFSRSKPPTSLLLEAVITTNEFVAKEFPPLISAIVSHGWNTTRHQLMVDEWRGTWVDPGDVKHEQLLSGKTSPQFPFSFSLASVDS